MLHVLIRKIARKNLQLYYVDPATRREVSKSAGTPDRNEAERAAAIWEQQLIAFRGSNDSGWEFFRMRFQDEHLAALSPKSGKIYRTALNAFERLSPVGDVAEVTPSHLSRFQSLLMSEERPLTTIATYLTHLRSAFNWAETMGMVRKAPRVQLPKIAKRRLMKGRPLDLKEHKAMLRACESDQLRRLLDLLWFSGLRLGEALALSWDSPPVQVALDGKPHPHLLFHAEGHKARTDVACPIPPDFAKWLAKTPKAKRRGYVVPLDGGRDGRFRTRTMSEVISNIGKAAGIWVAENKPASAHDYRRSYGTRWASKVRPLTLQRMMRHSTMETTMRFYVTLSSADVGAELWGE